jgi:hypothetical protein
MTYCFVLGHTPTHLLSQLGENMVQRINLVAGPGERVWTEANRLATTINVALAKGAERGLTRAMAATEAVRQWLEAHGTVVRGSLAQSGTPLAVKKELSRSKGGNGQTAVDAGEDVEMEVDVEGTIASKGKGNKEKDDHMVHLVKHGSTLEMVLDCRLALFVFDKILKPKHAKAMATERGASFTAHIWLSIRTLFKVSLGPASTPASPQS